MTSRVPRTLLLILDGFGLSSELRGNAIAAADAPVWTELEREGPLAKLQASGRDVGLPEGLMGSSEVGHLNIGAGRIVPQDIVRINSAIEDRSLRANPALLEVMTGVRRRGCALHVLGLYSDGGVHSLDRHFLAVVEMARELGVDDIRVHPFLDGRDTPPSSSLDYLDRLERALGAIGGGRIATICGRYYAMDRDHRWARLERAWRAIALGEGTRVASAGAAIRASLAAGVTDEFVEPVVLEPGLGGMCDGDGVVFVNFRADRAREMTLALTAGSGFTGFVRPRRPDVNMVTMTLYDPTYGVPAAFPPLILGDIFADVLAELGVANLRVAETEKYAHMTYFFNGRTESPRPYESRILVPSPAVATYDLQPEMSAKAITDHIVDAMATGSHDVIVANYANADMVGHSGVFAATVRAVEVIDQQLSRLVAAAALHGYGFFLTADHGNAEEMLDANGGPLTAHTTHPVPFVARVPNRRLELRDSGRLADVIPTILDWWGHEKPTSMTGQSLLR